LSVSFLRIALIRFFDTRTLLTFPLRPAPLMQENIATFAIEELADGVGLEVALAAMPAHRRDGPTPAQEATFMDQVFNAVTIGPHMEPVTFATQFAADPAVLRPGFRVCGFSEIPSIPFCMHWRAASCVRVCIRVDTWVKIGNSETSMPFLAVFCRVDGFPNSF